MAKSSLDDVTAQAELAWLPYSLDALLGEVHRAFFPPSIPLPRVYFAHVNRLALLTLPADTESGARPTLTLSSLLSHPQTPKEVLGFVFKHELLHLSLAERSGARAHSPRFLGEEVQIAPECEAAWSWLRWNLFGGASRDERKLCTAMACVLPKGHRFARRIPVAECLARDAELPAAASNEVVNG